MNLSEKIYYNAINHALGSDYNKIGRLWDQNKSWEKSWQQISKLFNKIEPEQIWNELINKDIQLLLNSDLDYPEKLKKIPDQPFGIYLKGKVSLNKKLAVVGTRRASPQGKEITKEFVAALVRSGLDIVSGLALGIDAIAHDSWLQAGGQTLAVLGGGLGNVYPKNNISLADKILENNGALISEYPFAMPPLPHHFIMRNRLISGLADAVLVIEAPIKSGSLATARFANDQNKDVFVIPGGIKQENYRGSNQLIKDGAIMVTEANEILDYLGLETFDKNKLLPNLSSTEEIVYTLIKRTNGPIEIDQISIETNLPINEISTTLTLLTLKQLIKENNGKYYI